MSNIRSVFNDLMLSEAETTYSDQKKNCQISGLFCYFPNEDCRETHYIALSLLPTTQ